MATVFGPKGPLMPTTMLCGPTPIVKNRFVKRGADADHAVPATAASINLGIAADNQDNAEKTFPLIHRPGETFLIEIGAAVAIDALLTSDANGRAVTATTTQNVSAIAREAGTTLGQLIVCEVVNSQFSKAP